MPSVHVYLWPGRSAEEKADIIAGITRVLESHGIPASAVDVLVHEVPKENWGLGGVPASKRFPDTP